MKHNSINEENQNSTLLAGVQIINLCIGVILTLICILIYITIESKAIKYLLIIALISIGLMCFIKLFKKTNSENLFNEDGIKTIALVNEDNQIIKEWPLSEKVSILIGKSNVNNEVDIDLSGSIYSNLIEEEHAILNYAAGKWYIEDLSSHNGVSIQKIKDCVQYRLVSYSPCTIKKGDTLYIAKTKLLLR